MTDQNATFDYDLNVVPELVAAFTVTTIDNKEGSVGGIYRTVGALSAVKNKIVTNGYPTVFPLPGNKLLLTEANSPEPIPFKLITPESGAKWTTEDNPVDDLTELRSVAVIGDNVIGITASKHKVVKFDSSATPWKVAKTCIYEPVVSGATAVGQLLGIAGKYLIAAFNEIVGHGTPDSKYSEGQLVIFNPDDLTPISGTVNGQPAKSIPVGKNATALDIFKPNGANSYDIFVACAGGKQGTPKGNGQDSRLDYVSLEIDEKGAFKATSKTLLTGVDENSNDIQSVAICPVTGAAFLLFAKIHSFDEETKKSRATWELHSTSVGILKLLDKAPISILGIPVQRNIYDFEEGFLWDLLYNSKKKELWMGHGNDIYIFRLTDRDPWGDPDAFTQEEMNKDPFGNLHSFCVPVESQDGILVKDLAGQKSAVARTSSIREALKHVHLKDA
ncbi:MAG: hypothetical protein LBE27_04725 [Deltaproteobacteria bacterium]|jgi:hypothetical protein|nr:hypothetical protein [Deltaproteobacteria bacterium]